MADFKTYPFDPTGSEESNLILNEIHTVSPPEDVNRFYFIVPRLGPFFKDGLVVRHADSNRVLVESKDYVLAYEYREASRACATPIYGAIVIINNEISGVLQLTYQTIGGDFSIDSNELLTKLSNITLNPRVTTWEQVANPPYQFPVIDHNWHVDDMTRVGDVISALDRITAALVSGSSGGGTSDGGGSHILDFNNPHRVNKEQIGLPNVPDWRAATVTDLAEAVNPSAFTSVRDVAVLIKNLIGDRFDNLLSTENPFNITATTIGLNNVRNIGTATDSVLIRGESDDHLVTVLGLTKYLDHIGIGNVADHFSADNPHNISAATIGLNDVPNWGPADDDIAERGLSDNTFMSPYHTRIYVQKAIGESRHFNFGTLAEYVDDNIEQSDLDRKVVNLSLLRAVVEDIIAKGNDAHSAREDNPHNVTKDQVGLTFVNNYRTATIEEHISGEADDLYATPAGVKAHVQHALNTFNNSVIDDVNVILEDYVTEAEILRQLDHIATEWERIADMVGNTPDTVVEDLVLTTGTTASLTISYDTVFG